LSALINALYRRGSGLFAGLLRDSSFFALLPLRRRRVMLAHHQLA
jgi:hypothetical protein